MVKELKKQIHDENNGLDYVLVGDYYIPDIKFPEETRKIGKWGQMHRAYLQEHNSLLNNELLLSGKLWSYLADLNEQAEERLNLIISQMQTIENVTEQLKSSNPMEWVGKIPKFRFL